MKLHNALGYKFFKEEEDGIRLIRIVYVRTPFKPGKVKEPSTVTIYDYKDKTRTKIRVEDLKDYTPLEPDAVFTASVISLRDNKGQACKDVVCTVSDYMSTRIGDLPFAVCRQSITDIFYTLIMQKEENDMVGCSVNRSTCPEGFDFRMMLMAEHIDKYMMINFYRNDTVEDILLLLPQAQYNAVLTDLYYKHCNHSNKKAIMKNEDKGWCKDISTLLKINNFEADINQMLGITDVGFEVKPYIVTKKLPGNNDEEYESISDDLREWLSSIFKLNITDATILEYDHDIDIVEFQNSKYLFLRDKTKKLYMIVYNENGEYFEADLDAKAKEYDFSTKFKIDFYNKYNDINV